jgi:hypothetical protein
VVVPAPLDQIIRWLTAGKPPGDLWARGPAESAVVEVPLTSQWKRRGAMEKARL